MSNSIAFHAANSNPGDLGWNLHRARHIASPAPGSMQLSPDLAVAEFSFDSKDFESGRGTVSDGVLCALAESVGAIRAAHAVPKGASYVKLAMTFTYAPLPDPATGQVRVECRSAIDWTRAGKQMIEISGFDGRGLPLFTAEMRLLITPAAT